MRSHDLGAAGVLEDFHVASRDIEVAAVDVDGESRDDARKPNERGEGEEASGELHDVLATRGVRRWPGCRSPLRWFIYAFSGSIKHILRVHMLPTASERCVPVHAASRATSGSLLD